MADGSTTNHGFILPEVGLAKNTWGNSLNDNWDALDAILDEGSSGLFVAKTGGTMTGALQVSAGTEAEPSVQWSNQNNGIYWSVGGGPNFTAGGVTIGELRGGLSLATIYSIVTRQAGDNRYLQLSGGTITGDLAVNGNINAGLPGTDFLIGHGGANAFLANYGPGAIQFRQGATTVADFQDDGTLILRRAANGVIGWTAGDLYFQKNGTTIAVLREDAQFLAGSTILTTPGADTRYTQKSWSVSSGAGLTGGGDGSNNRTISMGTPSSITAASTNSASGNTHTHSITEGTIRTLISAGGAGNIGTYAFLFNQSGPTLNPGNTTAGSNLRYASDNGISGTSPPGTWRVMGYCPNGSSSLYLRIA